MVKFQCECGELVNVEPLDETQTCSCGKKYFSSKNIKGEIETVEVLP